MKKLKKVLISLGGFFVGLIAKAGAVFALVPAPLYGIPAEEEKTSFWSKISGMGKYAIPILFFVIGLIVIISKKITKKIKMLIIALLLIALYLNYFSLR